MDVPEYYLSITGQKWQRKLFYTGLFRINLRESDAHVYGITDGDAGREFVEIRAADKIDDEGVDGQRAQKAGGTK